jgi:hypothetical protein
MEYLLAVEVEEKEDETLDGVRPDLPGAPQLCARLTDVLADVTKHDGQLGWRVTLVRPAEEA